ncbi:BNR repeat-containing protein [Enterobacter hormaechei]|nr:BNR repeat-containing protein [Enterobacter hormaechei]
MNNKSESIAISAIGPCCSDFTVDYALLVRDKIYVAYYDPEHCITVASRELDGKEWVYSQPQGEWLPDRNRFMHQTEHDSHNYLTLAMDNEGHIHLSGNMHKDKLVWFRSQKNHDIHSLVQQTMTGEREESTTYPLFFYGHNGELLFRYRDGESGNGDDIYNRWNDVGHCWERLLDKPLLSGMGKMNAYARLPVFGPDNLWHMIWMWRDTPHCETCHDLSYARSPDLLRWFTHDGKPISLPATRDSGDIVDPAPVEHGLINMSQNIGFDNAGNVLITWHRYDENGNSQAWIARPEGERWIIKKLSDWNFRWDFKGMGSIPPEVIISSPYHNGSHIVVTFALHNGISGEWWIDDKDLTLINTCYGEVKPLPEKYYIAEQCIDPSAEVQILPELYQTQPTHFLRWEALPIQRDIATEQHVVPSTLCLMSILE